MKCRKRHSSALFAPRKAIGAALVINLLVSVLEAIGGLLANSLALLSDALHNFSDCVALGIALIAAMLATRAATRSKTYGYVRFEVIAAFVNALLLVVLGAGIIFEGVRRLLTPTAVQAPIVLAFGVLGILANLLGAYVLHHSSTRDLNARAAYLHLLADAGHSMAVVLGGVLMYLEVPYVDPVVSILIGLLLLRVTWTVLKDTTDILVEGAPKGVSAEDVTRCLVSLPGVLGVHHVHVWSLSSQQRAMSAHVVVADRSVRESQALMSDMAKRLKVECGIDHPTFQLEVERCDATKQGQACGGETVIPGEGE